MAMDFSIVERPAGKATSAFRLALITTATTGKALHIPTNGDDPRLITSRVSGAYHRTLLAKGLRLRTQSLPDKSAVLVWAEKMETTS